MNSTEQIRKKCVYQIDAMLCLFERIEEFASFCSHYRGVLKSNIIPKIRIDESGSAVPGEIEHTNKLFDKFISISQRVKEVTENLQHIKQDMEKESIAISLKFYAFLDVNFLNPYKDQDQTMNRKLSEFLPRTTEISEIALLPTTDISQKELVAKFRELLTSVSSRIEGFEHGMKLLGVFDKFKEIDKNIVMIGPNGCGKSTFSREVAKQLGLNATVIPAQKLFFYNEKSPINPELSRETIHQQQKQDKLGRDVRQDASAYTQDFDTIIHYLISEHIKYSTRKQAGHSSKTTVSILNNVVSIWKEIIIHRELNYHDESFSLHVSGVGIGEYPLMGLSDGEKAVLYFIAHIMLAEENTYIIVDEPENHLNLSVVNRLWDRLEQERKDCQFIYLTHNPDFAVGRRNADILWVANMSPHSTVGLKYKKIEDREDIDKRLMIELVGSRQKILFCEGVKGSLDYKTYSLLFPEWKITPVGGCEEVIRHTQVYNKSSQLFNNSAIGIVDGDFRTNVQADSLQQKKAVYCLRFPAIENLLHDEILLAVGVQKLHTGKLDAIDDAKDKLFTLLAEKKEEQASLCVTREIYEDITHKLSVNNRNFNKYLCTYKGIMKGNTDIYEKMYNDRIQEIEEAVTSKDFNKALTLYKCKSIEAVGGKIVDDYTNRIIGVLSNDKQLCAKLRNKYFPEINEKVTNNSMPVAVATTMPPKEPHDI